VVDAGGRDTPLSIARLDFHIVGASDASQPLSRDDELLKAVGARLVDELPEGATIVRWEGDDFVVLFPKSDTARAIELLGAAQTVFSSSRFERSDGDTVELTFSGGIIPVEPETLVDEAVATADHLLVRARTEGPSRLLSPQDVVERPEPTILVAEDDRVAASLVKHRLARAGFDVVHLDDGAKALSAAMERNVSLFVLDIRMPGMDGLELLKRLRESDRYAEAPVLMLTSLGREEDIVRAFDLGATDYVTKPFSPVELLARVQRLLRRQGARTAQ
jgi:PleD family two-component response regulator